MPLLHDDLPRRTVRSEERLPPGQKLVKGWPVLHEGDVPTFDPATWSLTIDGAVEREVSLTWDALCALQRREVVADFHCVTTWSRFDNRWSGFDVGMLLAFARPLPSARFVMAGSYDDFGYTTNLSLEDLLRDGNLVATHHDGEPLALTHGGPVRLVVHHLYAWKSCKWLDRLTLMEDNRRGYWEENGYHNQADPWLEQRYRYQE